MNEFIVVFILKRGFSAPVPSPFVNASEEWPCVPAVEQKAN